jgi:hypothetical protein
MKTFFKIHKVEDETKMINYGKEEEYSYFSFSAVNLGLSYSDHFPDNYKIAGLTVFVDFN